MVACSDKGVAHRLLSPPPPTLWAGCPSSRRSLPTSFVYQLSDPTSYELVAPVHAEDYGYDSQDLIASIYLGVIHAVSSLS